MHLGPDSARNPRRAGVPGHPGSDRKPRTIRLTRSLWAWTRNIVRHRLGQPTNRMTGADLLAKFASVADTDGGRQIAAIRTREYWLYENTPPGADTQIVIGPDKHVEDVAVRPHRGAGAD